MYYQDPVCQREVHLWQAARRQARRRQQAGDVAERDRRLRLFSEEVTEVEPRLVEVNAAGVRVENSRQFGGPWLALHIVRRLQLDTFLE